MSGAAWTMVGIVGAALIVALARFLFEAAVDRIVNGIRVELRPLWRQDIEDALEPVYDELSFNGGQSVKDMVRRIEQQVETLLHETR